MGVRRLSAVLCGALFLMGAAPPGKDAFDDALDWLWYGLTPRNEDTAPGRTLVQLGLPTPTTISVWHLCPTENPVCEVSISANPAAEAIVQSPHVEGARRITLSGYRPSAVVKILVVTSWTAGGQPRSRTDLLSGVTAPAPMPERTSASPSPAATSCSTFTRR